MSIFYICRWVSWTILSSRNVTMCGRCCYKAMPWYIISLCDISNVWRWLFRVYFHTAKLPKLCMLIIFIMLSLIITRYKWFIGSNTDTRPSSPTRKTKTVFYVPTEQKFNLLFQTKICNFIHVVKCKFYYKYMLMHNICIYFH